MSTPYRSSANTSPVVLLAEEGHKRRLALGYDPHTRSAPLEVTDVRQNMLERVATEVPLVHDRRGRERWFGDYVLLVPYLMLAFGAVTALCLTIAIVSALHLHPFFVSLAFLLICTTIGTTVSRARSAPRRWLATRPLPVAGYLELGGREHRVTRLLVRVRFRTQAPDALWFGDVMTGAEVISQGVERHDERTVDVYSPEIEGSGPRMHQWFQYWLDRVMLPIDELYPVLRIEVIER
ncbi:MAG: hypothetical protein Q8Q09_07510 [Deltaproteobacteria bacterium]|nr:hypothetical protein [Deltaproteobacteria bacterium]